MARWSCVGAYKDVVLRFWHWVFLLQGDVIWIASHVSLEASRPVSYGGGRVMPSGNWGVGNRLGG